MHHLKREKNPAAVTNFKPTGHLYRHLLFLDKQHDETTEAEIEHSRGREFLMKMMMIKKKMACSVVGKSLHRTHTMEKDNKSNKVRGNK